MAELGTCALCDKPAVAWWSLSDSEEAAEIELCDRHSGPLRLALYKGRSRHWKPRRNYKPPVLEPFDWTPPEEEE